MNFITDKSIKMHSEAKFELNRWGIVKYIYFMPVSQIVHLNGPDCDMSDILILLTGLQSIHFFVLLLLLQQYYTTSTVTI